MLGLDGSGLRIRAVRPIYHRLLTLMKPSGETAGRRSLWKGQKTELRSSKHKTGCCGEDRLRSLGGWFQAP